MRFYDEIKSLVKEYRAEHFNTGRLCEEVQEAMKAKARKGATYLCYDLNASIEIIEAIVNKLKSDGFEAWRLGNSVCVKWNV